MGLPKSREARAFYRSAKQRFVDSQFLLDAGRTTGAIYLAGYGIECIFKALILDLVPARRRAEILASFRGAKGHDYEWLERQYRDNGGPPIPRDARQHFIRVSSWSTDFRYLPGIMKGADAKAFLAAAEAILTWAERRL